MGTRGLIYLTIRGEKRSCYVHLDSFPQRLGAALAQFILDLDTASRLRMAAMLEKVSRLARLCIHFFSALPLSCLTCLDYLGPL